MNMLNFFLKLVRISSLKSCPIYKGLFQRTMSERFYEFVIKDLAGEITPQECQELHSIISEDTVSARQYELFRMYWAQHNNDYIDGRLLFENVQSKIQELEKQAGLPVTEEENRPVRKIVRLGWVSAAAAAIALLITVGGYFFYQQLPAANEARLEKLTAKGEKSSFILDDGTRVTLNADSKLEYGVNFPKKHREVYLTGEAFFDVHADAERPFIIHTDKMDIKVLGTAFNVKSYPNELSTEATLLKGAIEVTMADNPSEKIVLKPSQKLVLEEQGTVNNDPSSTRKPVSIRSVKRSLTTLTYFQQRDTMIMETSWMQNKLTFQDEDFESLARRMERWYNVSIRFNKHTTRQLRFTGILEGETIAEALNAMHLTEDFRYKITNTTIEIY